MIQVEKINVKRENRNELLKIRNGEWSYDELILMANSKMSLIEKAYTTSSLPDEPDHDKIEKLLVEIRNELYN